LISLPINQIICGDCLEVMKTFPDKSIDLIVTDPPYFLPAVHYNTRKYFSRNFADLGILEHFFKDVFKEFSRIIKQESYIYIFCNGQSYPLFYFHLYPFCKSVRPLIWDKLTSINGYSWRHQHELIIFAEMPKSKPIPSGDGDVLKCRAVKVDERLHPAQKPLDLIKRLIQKSSKENDIILDPFAGSGTTCIAAQELNRRWLGIDISRKYCNIASARFGGAEVVELKEASLPSKPSPPEKKEQLVGGTCGYAGACSYRNEDGNCLFKRPCKDKRRCV